MKPDVVQGGVEKKKTLFVKSLITGMLYNRYWLYTQLNKIIELLTEKSIEYPVDVIRNLFESMKCDWQIETYREIPVLQIEKNARLNEAGLIQLPSTVIDQLNSAMLKISTSRKGN